MRSPGPVEPPGVQEKLGPEFVGRNRFHGGVSKRLHEGAYYCV